MASVPSEEGVTVTRTPLQKPVRTALLALAVFLAVGVALVFAYVNMERQRDLQGWQVRLGTAADTQFQAVDQWLNSQFRVLQGLADNASLRFYLTQVLAAPSAPVEEEPAQLGYLRNLLVATADQNGFLDQGALGTLVRANLPPNVDQGIALLGADGRVLVATPGFSLETGLRDSARQAQQTGKSGISPPYLNRHGAMVLGFALPLRPLHATGPADQAIGVLVGLKRARDELYPLLARRLGGQDEETILVARDGDNVVNLSPLGDGSAPLQKRLLLATPRLAAAFALASPGRFAADQLDYQGKPVLMTSRAFQQVPWVLVHTVQAETALQESRAHQRFLLAVLLLATLAAGLGLVAAWRHGSSVQARLVADRLRSQSQQLTRQATLLQSITDHSSEFIAILDAAGQFVFTNPSLARAIGMDSGDLPGKSLTSVLGAEPAHALADLLATAAKGNAPVSAVHDLEIGGKRRTYANTAVPFQDADATPRLLLVAHDVTALQAEQRRQSELLRNLICTLMHAVDRHDPHCANHSERTAQVALAIGQAMGLEQADLGTLEMAGQLANVGKLYVPGEILVKTEPLSVEEQHILRQHVQYALDILSGLDFEGRVLDTIAQMHEYLDGSGYPNGLREPELLQTGRILAVANAFVAMVSARAYRPGLGVEQALDQLLRESKTRYDRHVVAALFHVAENRRDWMAWAEPDQA